MNKQGVLTVNIVISWGFAIDPDILLRQLNYGDFSILITECMVMWQELSNSAKVFINFLKTIILKLILKIHCGPGWCGSVG